MEHQEHDARKNQQAEHGMRQNSVNFVLCIFLTGEDLALFYGGHNAVYKFIAFSVGILNGCFAF